MSLMAETAPRSRRRNFSPVAQLDGMPPRVKYAMLVINGVLSVKAAAAAADVHRQTIWRWVNEQLAMNAGEKIGR